jgi:hypothetical protein
MGQGSYTALGADCRRRIGGGLAHSRCAARNAEPQLCQRPVRPRMELRLFARVGRRSGKFGWPDAISKEWAKRSGFMITGRLNFDPPVRTPLPHGGRCSPHGVVSGGGGAVGYSLGKLRNANGFRHLRKETHSLCELVAEAATYDPPSPIPLRASPVNSCRAGRPCGWTCRKSGWQRKFCRRRSAS